MPGTTAVAPSCWTEALEAARQQPIVERCMATVEEWRDRGLTALHAAPTDGPREQLTAIAEFVTQRDF